MGVTQTVGSLGEELTVKFLKKRGYKILDRNYRRPWGELDIVAKLKKKVHFVEVKTMSQDFVSDETREDASTTSRIVTHETSTALDKKGESKSSEHSKINTDNFRPEDHMTRNKMKRLSRIIQTYLMGKHVSDETDWQFDVATVLIETETRRAKINLMENIIF